MHLHFSAWVIICLSCAGLLFFFLTAGSLKKKRPLKALKHLVVLIIIILTLFAYSAVKIGMRGYKTLTKEELAASVTVSPMGKQQFRTTVKYPDGKDTTLLVAGDELYIDARIIKWKPVANIFGLHTWYRLDRISGRYLDIDDEKSRMRTVYTLTGKNKYRDLFWWRMRYTALSPLLDARYGSASFVPVKGQHTFNVMVSTTGLLIRTVD